MQNSPSIGDRSRQFLFHAFPRRDPTNGDYALGVLESILSNGLLCTPEMGGAGPAAGMPRASFTLGAEHELSMLRPGQRGLRSHSDVFGHFAIGVDPADARRLGLLPVVYYCDDSATAPGLGRELAARLQECVRLLHALAHIEGRATRTGVDNVWVPGPEQLAKIGIDVAASAAKRLSALEGGDADWILSLLDNGDRTPSYNITDLLETLLSLYQTTDAVSTSPDLDFYQQREWRLVRHTRIGLDWFCLGATNAFASPRQSVAETRVRAMREALSVGREKNEDYLARCWVLDRIDDRPFCDFVTRIVVPSQFLQKVEKMAARLAPSAKVVTECRPWRMTLAGSTPCVVLE